VGEAVRALISPGAALPLGELTLVADDAALSGLYFEQHRRRPPAESFGDRRDQGFEEAHRQLEEYFAGDRGTFQLPLAPRGDDFQLQVWRRLLTIPRGETRTYGDLARALGNVTLSQAVGAANARNPLCIVVPCHRVVGADGTLTGYAGGLDRKRFLLALEESTEAKAARLF
jgi:methylated-DNA-[protein]-cysteine S-methyltransferase